MHNNIHLARIKFDSLYDMYMFVAKELLFIFKMFFTNRFQQARKGMPEKTFGKLLPFCEKSSNLKLCLCFWIFQEHL